MSARFASTIAIATLVSVSPYSLAQIWTSAQGPAGARVDRLVPGSAATLALTAGGIYRLAPNASTWQRTSNLPSDAIFATFSVGQDVFLGRRDAKISRSLDAGLTWTTIPGPRQPTLPGGWDARILDIDADASTWFAVLTDQENNGFNTLYRSTNQGQSWVELPVPEYFTGPVFASGNEILALASQFGFFRAVIRSTDQGQTWAIIGGGTEDQGGLPGSPFNESGGEPLRFDNHIVIGSYSTTDLGQTWRRHLGPDDQPLAIAFKIGPTFYAYPAGAAVGLEPELWKSDDLITWIRADQAIPTGGFRLFAPRGASLLAAGPDGVITSTNAGQSWSDLDLGIVTSSPRTLLASGPTLFASSDSGLSLERSTNTAWTSLSLAPAADDLVLSLWSPDDGQTILVGTEDSGIFISSNAGQSWSNATAGIPLYGGTNGTKRREIQAFAKSGSALFAATGFGSTWLPSITGGGGAHAPPASPVLTGGGVLRSTNNGLSWQVLTNGLPVSRLSMFGEPIRDPIASIVATQGIVLIGTASTGVFRSTNNGDLWTPANVGLPAAGAVPALTVIGNTALASTAGSIFRSTNAGQSWLPSGTGWPQGQTASVLLAHGSDVFAGISPASEGVSAVYRSKDQGQTWQPLGAGLQGVSVSALAVRQGRLFAGVSGAGVWSVSIACTADTDDGSGTGTPDQGVGVEDLLYYLTLFQQGVAAADVDDGSGRGVQDSGVGIEDLLYFLARFEAGC